MATSPNKKYPLMDAVTPAILRDMVDRIVVTCNPEKVILFGSHSRGDADDDSDVDFIVIVPDGFNGHSRQQELQRICAALREFVVPKDVLLYSESEANYWRGSENNLLGRALRDGDIRYARS